MHFVHPGSSSGWRMVRDFQEIMWSPLLLYKIHERIPPSIKQPGIATIIIFVRRRLTIMRIDECALAEYNSIFELVFAIDELVRKSE